MRILVLQLARFGDIYQSWPTLRALQRTYPGCELHLLVRERFRAAADSLSGVTVHAFPTREILRPLAEADDAKAARERLEEFFAPLMKVSFDQIVNLTFSPLSSYITDWLAGSQTQIRGYTRHADGHFHAPDDTSAYFHAQAGVGRANRYHVTEIFAAVAGVELKEEDFFSNAHLPTQRAGIVVHLAASTAEKAYPPELWIEVLNGLSEQVTLVGSKDERDLSVAVSARIPGVINRTGETTLPQLFATLAQARLLIGSDSAPVHMAALTATPVLNLSCARVNFWETGPLSAGSRVLYAEEIAQIPPQSVVEEAEAMLSDGHCTNPCYIKQNLFDPYQTNQIQTDNFSWNLVQALYTGAPYPTAEMAVDRLTFQRLVELAELALQQLARWENSETLPVAAKILAQIDEMLIEVAKLNPRVDPLIQWFETERLRIPPGSDQETLERTRKCFHDLYVVASVYHVPTEGNETRLRERAIELCSVCAPEIREHNLVTVTDDFQTLVSTLHDLARSSTKVANQSWSSVLEELNLALENKDYIQLADLLEWKLVPSLRHSPGPEGRDTLVG